MRPRRTSLALACVCALLAVAPAVALAAAPASLRLASGVSTLVRVDLTVDGKLEPTGARALGVSPTWSIPAGRHTLVALDRRHVRLARLVVTLTAGGRTTVVLAPSGRGYQLLAVRESVAPASATAIIVDLLPASPSAAASLAGAPQRALTTGHATTVTATPGDDGVPLPLAIARGGSSGAAAGVDPIAGATTVFLLVIRGGQPTLVALPRASAAPSQAAPTITGEAHVDQPLGCQTNALAGVRTTTYAWLVDGTRDATTTATRPTTAADAGHALACRATVSGPGGSLARRSAAMSVPAAPSVTISSAPSGGTLLTAATIDFTTTGVVDGATCSVNGAAAAACTAPLTLADLAVGSYAVAVTVAGPGGVAHASTSTWTVLAKPTVSFTVTPPATTDATAVVIAWAASAGADITCTLDASACTFSGLATGKHLVTVTASGNGAQAIAQAAWTQVPYLTLTAAPSAHTTADTADITFTTNGAARCALDGVLPSSCAPLSGLAAGPHVLAITADGNDGTAALPLSVRWTVDPTLTVSGPANPTTDASPSVTFTTTPAAGVTTLCALDGASSSTPCTSPVALAGLGQHSLRVTASGGAGTIDASATATWRQDPPAPTVAFTTVPAARSTETSARLAWTASGVVSTSTCTLDGTIFTPCTSPLKLDAVPAGTHAFVVTVANITGGDAASATWILDPTLTVTAPPTPTVATSATIAWTATPVATPTTCTVDNGAKASCTSPLSLAGLAVGAHALTVTATGGAGSTPVSKTVTWQQDPPAPTATITSQPASTIAWTTSGVVTTQTCTLDAVTASCTSPFDLSGLASGTHAFLVSVGNVSGTNQTPTVSWIVQHALTISSPASPTTSTSASITFAAAPAGKVTYLCSIDSSVSTPCTSPVPYSELVAQKHTVTVTATGGAGSTPVSKTVTWQQDPPAPTVAITNVVPARTTATTMSVAWAASGLVATTSCTLDGAPLASCSTPINVNVGAGQHAVAVSVGNVTGMATASATWIVDPTVTITTPPVDSIATTASVAYATTPTSGLTLTCKLNRAQRASCASPIVVSGLAEGPQDLEITATGAAPSNAVTVHVLWNVLPPVPTVTITAPITGTHQTATSAPVVFTLGGAPPTSVTCQVDAVAATACTSPYTAALPTSGTHTITVVAATATAVSSPASTTVIVDPTITFVFKPANPTTAIGGFFAWTVTPALTPFTCKLDGVMIVCPAASYTLPALALGQHTFAVSAAGGTGATPATATYTWKIQAPLTVTILGPGGGSVSATPAPGVTCTSTSTTTCTGAFDAGTTVTLTAVPNATSLAHGFSGCLTATLTTCTVLLDQARAVQASFVPANVTLSVGTGGVAGSGGSVASTDGKISCPGTCSASYPYGSSLSLTQTPDASSTFSQWVGGCTGSTTPCALTLTADTSVTAVFALRRFSVVVTTSSLTTTNVATGTVSSSGGISCPGTCFTSVSAGSSITLLAAPAADSQVATWMGVPCAAGALTCTFTPTADTSLDVSFTLALHALTLHVIGSGSVTDATNTIVGCTQATSPCSGLFPHYADEFLTVSGFAGLPLVWSGGGGAPSCNTIAGHNNPCQVTTISAIDVTVTIGP